MLRFGVLYINLYLDGTWEDAVRETALQMDRKLFCQD